MLLEGTRQAVADAAKEIVRLGLVSGTAGNVSACDPDTGYVAITPSAVPYDSMSPTDIVIVDDQGRVVDGRFRPSSETPMHLCVYRRRPWARAVVHTHSPYATTFACLGLEIPAVHYLIAVAGRRIPVAAYATYGTVELGDAAAEVMGDGKAVLLQHHGVLTAGRTLAEGIMVAGVVEYVATLYYRARQLGNPMLLPDAEVERLRVRFDAYRPTPNL
ncbi:MAG TPA: class II aldolase/adducin family protein [bacterium]|nr:class II aldolase/adducin family protein [bacterium]